MTDFDNTNRGVLFSNKDKKKTEKHPDYTGSINVDGVDHFLDAWIKTSQAGTKFMSISIKRKDKQAEAPRAPAKQAPAGGGFDDIDSEIPF